MPVSLSEWRVRIGTFVHWIREYEVKERRERLLKERIRRLKVLCERLEAKMGDSGEESEDDKSRQDGPDRKGCPHKTLNIQSSGNSSDIKDLLTSCDQCIQDLLSASDSHVKELLTPSDTCIKQLLTPRRERLQRIQRLKVLCERLEAKMGDCGEESKDDKIRQDDPEPEGCPHKTSNIRSSGNSSDIKDLLTSCNQCIQDLLTASDSHIKDILTPSGCMIKELITPNDCSIKIPNTLNDSTIKDIITPNDSGIKELVTTNDSRITNLVIIANDDSRIQGLFKANDDSRIQDLLATNYSSIRDPITPEYCIIKDVMISKNAGTKPLDTPNDSPNDLFNDSSIKDLITPNDSSIIDLITPEYSDVKDIITSNNSKIDSLLSPKETNINRLIKPDDDYIHGQLAQAYNYVKIVRTSDDESIEQDTQVGYLEEEHMYDFLISPRRSMSDASLRELLTSSYPSTTDLQTPTDDLNADLIRDLPDLIIETPYIKDHETQSDGSVKELSSPGSETTVYQPFAPCDDFLVELLKQNVSTSIDLPSIDLCWHEPDRNNEPFSEKSGQLPHFVGKTQHLQPDTFTKEAPGDELLKEHQTSSGRFKKSQNETSILIAGNRCLVVPFVSRKCCISERRGEVGESASTCHGPSFKSKTDLISVQIPPLSELLLLKSGDVELNPGPLEETKWSLQLEGELLSLVEEVPPKLYTRLCNALGVGHAQSKAMLTRNLLDVSYTLFEVICSWGVRQRDGTNYKRLLAEKLRSVHLDALGTKLVEGGYLTQDTPTQYPTLGTAQTDPIMTDAQVLQCGKDLKTFYREKMCKIKPDPLDFTILFEFEQIYTNLTLLRNKMGTRTKTPLDYTDLLTTKINGVLPKRLLVEGEGGVGKTTFCSKIAWDWVNGSPEFQRFSWVLVIPLRNVVKGQTIGDIMKNYLSDSNAVNPEQINKYILSQPTKVLIVLDGLDEYDEDLSAKESSDISQILRLEKFKECIVLVTTRLWRADKIKSNELLSRSYAFIAVEGFSAENVSTYISKYFANDKKAGSELIRFIEVNDVIKENMAPFPIYVAMLCILWENCDYEKRETIRKLKTFSQLFEQMIMYLTDHYVSKVATVHEAHPDKEIKPCFERIGSIAFSGLLKRKLVFNEEDFSSCKEAMETCCRIGVLSRENKKKSRWERTLTASQSVTTSVFFPHKLFQEYIASVYLASLYDTNLEEYSRSMGEVLSDNQQEFRYLLYFTAARGNKVGLDIVNKIQHKDFQNVGQKKRNNDFLADVTFEAYNVDTAKAVGQQIFADEKKLTFDKEKPAHTVSGYLFIMEQHGMETLVFRDRSCGPTVSRDLADVLFASISLSRLVFYRTTLDDDFYQLMHKHFSTIEGDTSSIKELVVDHQFLNGLHRMNNDDINVTVGDLFPGLTQLTFSTLHTVSPRDVKRLAHSSLAVLSIKPGKQGCLAPLIGEPTTLGQLFSSSFPQLTCLTFRGLVMGNIRSEAILRNLKDHLHLKSISIMSCFTDNELKSLAKQITTENRMKIKLQHKKAQRTLSFGSSIRPLTIDMIDALCHRTCVQQLDFVGMDVEISGKERFPDLNGRAVDSKIHVLNIGALRLHDNQSASCCLGKFLSLQPHLADLKIHSCSFHDDFYKEIVERSSSSKGDKTSIKVLVIDHQFLNGLQSFNNSDINVTVGYLFPSLTQLTFSTLHTVSPGVIEQLAHSSLAVLSIEHGIKGGELVPGPAQNDSEGKLVPLIGEPTSLGQLFLSSFPQLNCLSFRELVMGNIRSKAILRHLMNHLHLKSVSIISCYTDDELDPLAEQITTENRMKITLQHDLAQRTLSGPITIDMIDALCHQTCVHQLDMSWIGREIAGEECFPECLGREVHSKIQTVNLDFRQNYRTKELSHSASTQLAKFLCSLSYLTTLAISGAVHAYLHDDFFTELASLAASSQIQTVNLDFRQLFRTKKLSHSASKQLAKFLCSLPCLTTLAIGGIVHGYLHDNFFTELASLAEFSQIQTVNLTFEQKFGTKKLSHLASKQLAKFLCSLPCLTTLAISGAVHESLHDDFFTELASLAASSQENLQSDLSQLLAFFEYVLETKCPGENRPPQEKFQGLRRRVPCGEMGCLEVPVLMFCPLPHSGGLL